MKKIGKFSFVDTAAGQYALHMDWSHSMSQLFDLGGRNWDDDPVSVAGERVVPWGKDNNLPHAIRDLNENMIAAAYVVHAPSQYWKDIRKQVLEVHPDWTEEQVKKEIDRLKDRLTQQIADVMAGKNNAGKFFSCVDFTDDYGHAQSWKIEPIEMNIDKYIEAQAKISRIANSSITSGFGLSPALANIIIDGKSDSGSQMLYALKIFYGADTQIAEDIALEAVNDAIRINFPEKSHRHP